MIQLINIPTKSVDEAWGVVRTDIANALTRSNGYALSEHIRKWIRHVTYPGITAATTIARVI